jgi:hypothetical protein
LEVRLTIEEWEESEEEAAGLDPERGWTLLVTVADRTYYAGRTERGRDSVQFYWYSDPTVDAKDRRAPFWPDQPEGDRREPFRGGVVPYSDPVFEAAVRAVLELSDVDRVYVLTSHPTQPYQPVDLDKFPSAHVPASGA